MLVVIVNSEEEAQAAVAAAEEKGLRWAASGNAGLKPGQVRITFLPASAFKHAAIKETTDAK